MPDGNTIEVPQWALESTQEELVTQMKLLVKNAGGDKEAQKKAEKGTKDIVDVLKKGNKDQEKQAEEAKDAMDDVKESMDEVKESFEKFKADQPKNLMDHVINNLERDGEQFGRALFTLGEKALGLGALLGGVLVTGLTVVSNALLGAGEALNDLSDVGVGFNTTFQDVGKSATEAIAGMGALGEGFAGAAARIAANSNVVATQGFGRFQKTMQFAADTSEELGMSFNESMDRFSAALQTRQTVMDLSNVSQKQLTSTIQTTIKSQRTYSMALGVSAEELQNFTSQLLSSNGLLTATLIGFSGQMRNQVMGGMEVFASGLRGLGGEAGGRIAEAFTEAASAGAIGLSEGAVGYITALPSLAGPMNEYIAAVQNGTLSQDQAQDMVTDLTMSLGNLSAGEKARIKSLAIVGDESAQQMANAIAQFEQSERKMADLNKQLGTAFDMDDVQKGTNEFNKVLNQAKGAFSNAFYSLFADPEVTGALRDGLHEILGIFGFALDDVGGSAMDFGEVVKDMVPTIKGVIDGIVGVVKNIAGFFAQYMGKGEDGELFFDFGGLISGMIGKAIGAMFKALIIAVPLFAAGLFAFSAAKHIFKTTIMPQAQTFAMSMFSKGADVAKNVANTALGFAKSMFDKGKAGTIGKTISGLAGKVSAGATSISEKMGATGKGGVVGKVQDKLASFNKAGAAQTTKLQSAVSGGGKSGGFLKSIADGVKKFGDPKTVKGAASLVLLGGAIALAAVGLKQFNEVDFASIVKGGIAITGLAGVAKLLGKGSTAMMKGAAAVAILGASIIPMAFALNMMKDVGIGTIGVLAAGLITVGVAAAGLGFALPFILAGAVAIGALGLALIPFGIALNIAAMAMPTFTESIQGLSDVNFANLLLAGPALLSLSAGMMALSAGGLVSGLLDGLGGLFGGDSPFDKIAKIANSAKYITVMAEEMRNMGDTLATFEEALDGIDGDAIGSQFIMIADGLNVLTNSLNAFDFGSFLKLGALKMFMPSGPTTPAIAGPSPAVPTAGVGAGGPQINAFGPGITPTQVNADAVPQTGMSERMQTMLEERMKENQAKYGDAPGGFTQTVNGKTITNNNTTGQTDADGNIIEEGPTTNELLAKLVNLQEQNNRTGKKTQRNIEGLEI